VRWLCVADDCSGESRRSRPLADTWSYLLDKTTHRARGHSRRSAAPTASRAFARQAKNASARAPSELRGAADAEGGASSSRRAGRRDSSARDALLHRRQRPTRARHSPKLARQRARRSANTAPKGSAQQHRNHSANLDARAVSSDSDATALVSSRTTAPPHRHAPTAQIRTTTAVAPPKSPNFG